MTAAVAGAGDGSRTPIRALFDDVALDIGVLTVQAPPAGSELYAFSTIGPGSLDARRVTLDFGGDTVGGVIGAIEWL